MGSYVRVIPRDLFNESNLLKCYGKLYIEAQKHENTVSLEETGDTDKGFDICQDDDGCLSVANVTLFINGEAQELYRPLNSREPYPLYLRDAETSEDIPVFNDDGSFSAEMEAKIQPEAPRPRF